MIAEGFHNAEKYILSHSKPFTKFCFNVNRMFSEVVVEKSLMTFFTIGLYKRFRVLRSSRILPSASLSSLSSIVLLKYKSIIRLSSSSVLDSVELEFIYVELVILAGRRQLNK
jgi:hypothetical protein